MVKIAVFASGSGTNFENIVNKVNDGTIQNVSIELLVVDKVNAYATQRAQKLGIPYVFVNPKAFETKAEYEKEIIKYLEENEIDLIVLAGYMRIVSPVLLQAYPRRIINIHPAYLPNFPGAHAILDAFEAKASETGVTVHFVDEGIDTGEVIYQEKLPVNKEWSLETLEEHVHALEYVLYPKAIQMICDKIEGVKA